MIFHKEIETKMRGFGKIVIYQIWTDPDLKKKTQYFNNIWKQVLFSTPNRRYITCCSPLSFINTTLFVFLMA